MILSVDVGNTNISIGAYEAENRLFVCHILTEPDKTEVEYAMLFHHILHLHRQSEQDLEGAIISSVVPPLSPVLKAALQLCGAERVLQVGPGIRTGLNIRTTIPRSSARTSWPRPSARWTAIRCPPSSSTSEQRRKFRWWTAPAPLSAARSCRG